MPTAAVPSVDMLIDGLLDADDPVLALGLALGQRPRGLAPVPPIYSNDRDAQTVLDLCGMRFRWQHAPTRLAKERRGFLGVAPTACSEGWELRSFRYFRM